MAKRTDAERFEGPINAPGSLVQLTGWRKPYQPTQPSGGKAAQYATPFGSNKDAASSSMRGRN